MTESHRTPPALHSSSLPHHIFPLFYILLYLPIFRPDVVVGRCVHKKELKWRLATIHPANKFQPINMEIGDHSATRGQSVNQLRSRRYGHLASHSQNTMAHVQFVITSLRVIVSCLFNYNLRRLRAPQWRHLVVANVNIICPEGRDVDAGNTAVNTSRLRFYGLPAKNNFFISTYSYFTLFYVNYSQKRKV